MSSSSSQDETPLLLGDATDLRADSGGDELAELDLVEAGLQQAELEVLELEGLEVEVVEDTERGDLVEGVQLREQEQAVEVELLLGEQALESIKVEAVVDSETVDVVERELVQNVQVGKVLVHELEVVERVQVESEGASLKLSSSSLRGAGGSSSDESGQSADDDGGELHFDG